MRARGAVIVLGALLLVAASAGAFDRTHGQRPVHLGRFVVTVDPTTGHGEAFYQSSGFEQPGLVNQHFTQGAWGTGVFCQDCGGSCDPLDTRVIHADFEMSDALIPGQGITSLALANVSLGGGAAGHSATQLGTEPFCDGEIAAFDIEITLGSCEPFSVYFDLDGVVGPCAPASNASCLDILNGGGASGDGVYAIDPDGAGGNDPVDVYCDMTTDGGGWTLVASTLNRTLNDQASAYYPDLATLSPLGPHEGVWDGLRPLMGSSDDLRFSCRNGAAVGPFDVDLAFYAVGWYLEITTGTDADCCFEEGNGGGQTLPPVARRNLLTGELRPLGDQWNCAGHMEGEDSCSDTEDFTVDFDDRGMDCNESDGTDWGEDDFVFKCGLSGIGGGTWFIWARETPVDAGR